MTQRDALARASRGLGLVLALAILAMLVADAIARTPTWADAPRLLANGLVVAGLLGGWRWPFAGGVVAILGALLSIVPALALGAFPFDPFTILEIAAGALYVADAARRRERARTAGA